MGRLARVVVEGHPHHVVQRGNRRQPTFFSDGDYRAYLALMIEWTAKFRMEVWAYCLMPNHVHLVVVPSSSDSLARGIGEAHRRYTRRVNFREGWCGHLWQGRFASYVMDEKHLMAAARYIEQNPVKAGLSERAEDWPWSSAAAHVAGRGDALADGDWLRERTAGWACDWREYLAQPDDVKIAAALQRSENTGRPAGDESFLKTIGRKLHQNLIPKKAGRPKKEKN